VCYNTHTWVWEQDEDNVKSLEQPDLEVMLNSCIVEMKSERGGFFNFSNMQPERLPSAKQQRDGYDCGVFASLNWSMFVKVESDQPSLWDSINSLDDPDTRIVRLFWNCQEDNQDHFGYELCRLMECFLQEHLQKENRSYIAMGLHPLLTDWTYPKDLPVGFHYPPCAGGVIPKEYEELADLTDKPAGEKGPSRRCLPPICVHIDDEGYSNGRDCLDLSDTSEEDLYTLGHDFINKMKGQFEWEKYIILPSVDTNGRDLKLFKKSFNGFINKTSKSSHLNFQKRKAIFDTL
jgi:hypothetical protein